MRVHRRWQSKLQLLTARKKEGGRPQRTVYPSPQAVTCQLWNTHTLADIEPTTFQLLVWRATSRTTKTTCLCVCIVKCMCCQLSVLSCRCFVRFLSALIVDWLVPVVHTHHQWEAMQHLEFPQLDLPHIRRSRHQRHNCRRLDLPHIMRSRHQLHNCRRLDLPRVRHGHSQPSHRHPSGRWRRESSSLSHSQVFTDNFVDLDLI